MAQLIVVNKNDEEIRLEGKLKCHLSKEILHRAFTIFIFNSKGKLLIQKRSKNKLLWPLTWESSCSGHPLQTEDYITAGEKRLKEELGFSSKLKLLGKFRYQARYKNIGSENEICALLIGKYNRKVNPNPKEVAEWKWIDLKTLKKDLIKKPKEYTPWLKIAVRQFIKSI